MERKEYFIAAMLTAVTSIGVVALYRNLKSKPGVESPRGISIQRASIRHSRTINHDNTEAQSMIEEGPTILNALYIHSQESARQGTLYL